MPFTYRTLQIGMLLQQDELPHRQQLAALISDGTILLRDPIAPFDQLPQLQAKPVS